MEAVGALVEGLAGDKCRVKYDVQCLQEVVANCMNVGILIGSALVHLPQLVKIYNAKSVEGLSETTFLVQVLSNSLTMAYSIRRGISPRNWGEAAFMTLQFYSIVGFYWLYSRSSAFYRRFVLFCGYCSLMAFILGGALPESLMPLLGLSTVPFIIFGRVPQIILTFHQKHTGYLSGLTTSLLLLGNIARVFTTVSQVEDPLMLANHIVALVFNCIPLLQMFAYWDNTSKLLATKKTQ